MFLLFTTPSCPRCPAAKKMVQDKKIDVQVIDASTKEGLDLARHYKVAKVPTLLDLRNQKSIRKWYGLEEMISSL